MLLQLTVNGEPVAVPAGSTVADLLEQLGLSQRVMVVERNGTPVPRAERAQTVVDHGDQLELVRAVAGG